MKILAVGRLILFSLSFCVFHFCLWGKFVSVNQQLWTLRSICRYNFGWSHGKEKLESGKPGNCLVPWTCRLVGISSLLSSYHTISILILVSVTLSNCLCYYYLPLLLTRVLYNRYVERLLLCQSDTWCAHKWTITC